MRPLLRPAVIERGQVVLYPHLVGLGFLIPLETANSVSSSKK